METVVPIGPPSEELPASTPAGAPGVTLSLTHVTWREPASRGMLSAPGVSLHVPPGQILALHSEPAGDSRELLDVIAGLRRPLSGQENAAGVALEQQCRVLIARALRTSPRLILAEDPAPDLDSKGATAILDLLMDLQAQSGFTLLLAVTRLVTASCCERLVRLAGGGIIEDVLIRGDDPWTRGRIDRIG